MNILKSLTLTAIAAAALSSGIVHASIIVTSGQDTTGSAFALTSANVSGLTGPIGNFGSVLEAQNVGSAFGATEPDQTTGTWLAVLGTSFAHGSATVNFNGAGVSDVSFYWGTPDSYNFLTVTDQTGTYTITNPNGGNAGYVNIADTSAIKSMTFSSSGVAFEVSNFKTTTAVPEPASIALLGLGLLGVAAARRKNGAKQG